MIFKLKLAPASQHSFYFVCLYHTGQYLPYSHPLLEHGLNISMFDDHGMSQMGMVMSNSHGYAEVRRILMSGGILTGRLVVLIVSLGLVTLSLNPLLEDFQAVFSVIALSTILASLGLQITAPLVSFNTLEPWGLLGYTNRRTQNLTV